MAKRRKKTVTKPIQGVGFIMIDVENPNYNPAHEGKAGNPTKISAAYNPKESPAAWYKSKGIIQLHEYQAASMFRRLYERCGGSGIKAIDYAKDVVDGGQIASDGITESKRAAAERLSYAHDKLGRSGYLLVESVCGQGFWVKDLHPDQYMQRKQMGVLRGCLDELAALWGFKSRERFWRCA